MDRSTQKTQAGTPGLLRLPVELHILWFRYLSQPTLLRVSALSKFWRALVLDGPGFYLFVRLCAARGHHKRFIQHLNYARVHQRPIAICFDFPFPPTIASRDLLSKKLSPAIELSMHLVRRISIQSGAPLSASEVAFLATPAPLLREFVYMIDPAWEMPEKVYDSYSGSDSEYDYDGYHVGDINPYVRLPLVCPLFGHCAPMLTVVRIYGVTLPEEPVTAFRNATHVALGDLGSLPSVGMAAHFPATKHLKLTTPYSDYPAIMGCNPSSWIHWMSLTSLDLLDSARVLPKLLLLLDPATVQHLKINFNAHYLYEGLPGSSTMRSRAEERRDFEARDADWAACLAHLACPSTLHIFSTLLNSYGTLVIGVHATVRSASDSRTVTFYADDYAFCDQRDRGRQYSPLSGLASLSPVLTEVTLEQAHLLAIFHITISLPALRLLHVRIEGTNRRSRSFWQVTDCLTSAQLTCPLGSEGFPQVPTSKYALDVPALESLILSNELGEASIASHELALFGHALGIHSRGPDNRPNLVLRGVQVVDGTYHAAFFV